MTGPFYADAYDPTDYKRPDWAEELEMRLENRNG